MASRLTVYSAGAVRGPEANWREDLKRLLYAEMPRGELLLISPGANLPMLSIHGHGIADDEDADQRPDVYAVADLVSIRHSDIVVARGTATHSGRGTSFEMGYAHAMGKDVFLWCEKDEDVAAYVFARSFATVFRSLADLVVALRYACQQVNGFAQYDPSLPG